MNVPAVLVLNCGSSSIKFTVVEPQTGEVVLSGLAQRIGTAGADIKYTIASQNITRALPHVSYYMALQDIINTLQNHPEIFPNIFAVGHRVVHGGEHFKASVIITPEVLQAIKNNVYLAPLHNPANIIGIEEGTKAFPGLPQVAVFDTAFHQTMQPHAFIYPIPYELYQEQKVRRYGFHGTSHRFVSVRAAEILNKDLSNTAFITAHLGNGCSVSAVLNGKSVDTSMGLTPLEGLMMGSRSGDVDPSLHAYLADNLGYDIHGVTEILNKKSGLLGVSGISSDMREIEETIKKGNRRAELAVDIFCFRLAKYIAALTVSLKTLDALIFTGGIGENSQLVRAKTINWLKILNFEPDNAQNEVHGKNNRGIITTQESTIAMVVPTHEEWLIAQDAAKLAQQQN